LAIAQKPDTAAQRPAQARQRASQAIAPIDPNAAPVMKEPFRNGVIRPFIRVGIEVRPAGQPVFVGTLKASMYRAGTVHHFRVVDAQGVMWLVPPEWLSDHMLHVAGIALDRLDAEFLYIHRAVPHDTLWKAIAMATNLPAGLAPAEIVARLEQRTMEPVA
jgi:hypothetical protein